MQTNIQNAKSNLSQLAELACQGERVIITKDGKPFVQLIPYVDVGPRVFGGFKGQFKIGADFDGRQTNEGIAAFFNC